VIQNRLVSSPTWQSLGKIRSPYKGLEAFTEADAGNFYGREETIEQYAKLVATTPLVPIIGASGRGKSSLVQAGLIPYLKQDTASDWQILTMRPGRNPFDALAKAIFNADSPPERLRQRADLQTIELDVDLASDRHLLTQKLAQMRIPHRRILLFIDQFEELFTQSDDDDARQVFLQSLADAVSNAPNFVLVFTLRNDFLLTLQSDRQDKDFTGMLGRFGFQSFDGRMTDGQFKAAITKPVEKLGVEFEGGLVDRLMKDVGTADGSLPLLQLVLDLLWKNVQKRQLTHECYDAIGGKDGMKTVLAKLADDVYHGFVKQGKVKEFKQVFLRLVTIGEANTLNTRRIATRAEIETSGDNWREIVVPLSKERLLKTDLNEKGEEIVEVIHETLIQSWQTLAKWIDKHRQELERIDEIEKAAHKWDRNKRSKQDLLDGKKLTEAQKFSNNRDRFLSLKPIVNDFLRASARQQRWNGGQSLIPMFLIVGLIGGWIARSSLIAWNVAQINNYPKDKCESSQLSTPFELLKLMKHPLKETDLVNRDLSCINLSSANLRGANLRGAKLNGAILNDAILSDAILSDAKFNGAKLNGAILNGAILNGAILNGAKLNGAKLNGAILNGAILNGAKLNGAILSGADLNDAILSGAILNGADLRGFDLSNANLSKANLSKANLSGAILSGADLHGFDLHGFDLSKANLSGAILSKANLSGAILSGTIFNGANLSGAILSGADLRDFDLSDADLSGADLNRANLSGANLSGSDLSGADLRGAILNHDSELDETPAQQIKLAKNWETAKYDPEIRKKLRLK
jgi:uncharacterized protein YjbI with pentapeptide repeats